MSTSPKVASALITDVREMILDASSSAFTDARILAKLNAYYLRWYVNIERRVKWQTHTAMGWTFGAGDYKQASTLVDIMEVIQLFKEGAAGDTKGSPLEKYPEPSDFFRDYATSSTNGTPAKWAVLRIGTDTAADIGKHTVFVYPPASATTYISALVRMYPALLTISPTDTAPDVTPEAADTIARLTAVELATIMRRPADQIDAIASLIPDQVAQSFGLVKQAQMTPRNRPGAKAA